MTPTFIPGLQLSQRFYHEAVRPILDAVCPDLPHTAALIGPGSEVLGFDTPLSTDHDWGPRLQIFLKTDDHRDQADRLHAALAWELPTEFCGYSTHFTLPDPGDGDTRSLMPAASRPLNHGVAIVTIHGFFHTYLGLDLSAPLTAADWLTLSEQHLRSVTGGAVYHDGLDLAAVRARLAYFPPDVWRYLLACGWARIGQEEHLMGRAGQAGDEIGAALIAARLVRDIMRLCFLMERVYAPYPKWFGSAFAQLACAPAFLPHLHAVLTAPDWRARQAGLVPAYEVLARQHNALGLTTPMPEQTRQFFDRPFAVMALHGFSAALLGSICDPAVARIAQRAPIGSVEQFSDSTDLCSDVSWRPLLKQLYA